MVSLSPHFSIHDVKVALDGTFLILTKRQHDPEGYGHD